VKPKKYPVKIILPEEEFQELMAEAGNVDMPYSRLARVWFRNGRTVWISTYNRTGADKGGNTPRNMPRPAVKSDSNRRVSKGKK